MAGWTENNHKLRKEIILRENCDIYSICETHLSKNSNFIPSVPGYQLYRHDRSFVHRNAPKTWGGVGFLIRDVILESYQYSVIDKTFEGIFAIELTHKVIGTKILLLSCYLPPEYSPHGRNATSFYDHLTSLCYTHLSNYEHVYFCGDVNARIGKLVDCNADIDIQLPPRIVIDEKDNSHGKGFIEFLIENKFCVLNGRFDKEKDNFTSTGRGRSVVDYIFCPHDNFEYCSDFTVNTCKSLVEKHGLQAFVNNRSKPPDHSLIKINVQITSIMTSNDNNAQSSTVDSTVLNKMPYKVSEIPVTFMNNEIACNELLNLIEELEVCRENQASVDKMYEKLITCIFAEMDRHLFKYTGVKSKKMYKVKKPYWNDELKSLWSDMCNKEKTYLAYRGSNHIRSLLRQQFLDASRIFNKKLRQAERNYNKSMQDEMESVCTDNPRQFWEYIKKLGPKPSNKILQEVYDENGNIKCDLDSVLHKWKVEFENLYKSESDSFDDNFYTEIKSLLRTRELNMNDPLYVSNAVLNRSLTLDEVSNVIDRLKNKKATGIDLIPNEVLRSDVVKTCLLNFFQFYFDTGLLPQCWGKAIIKPIPKSKSNDPRIPLNYRGINLLSCIYKTYSTVINQRLLFFLENNNLLCDEQNGFRAKRSCLEHIYTLYTVIKNRKNQSLDTYVAFIDFSKCFDLIDRDMLYFKLIETGIDGKMYFTLKSMYSNTMSSVNINGNLTEWFYTMNGCRQGDVTSPTAFSILINDLLKELKASNMGVTVNDLIISALAYADDIVLLAESPAQLQSLIDIVHRWCCKYRFIVNPSKSNVVHFRNPPKQRTDFKFMLGTIAELNVVENYKYLGTFFDEYLTFGKATEVLSAAANRALGSMINKFKSMREMNYRTYTKLYESLVCPVMDYGSAVWGMKSYDKLDQVHNRAMRFFAGVHRLCPIPGFVGDMGWLDNLSRWKIERIRLWNRLINTNDDRLVKKIFLWDKEMCTNTNKANFISHLKQVCSDCELNECYVENRQIDIAYVKRCLLEKLGDKWFASCVNMSKLDLYKQIKTSFGTETFLTLNIDRYEKSLLAQLRYGILPLRVETGRFVNEKRCDRICTLCNTGNVEDQIHFLFHCNLYETQRNEFYVKARNIIERWDELSDIDKLASLFKHMSRALGKYVKNIFLLRRNKLYH